MTRAEEEKIQDLHGKLLYTSLKIRAIAHLFENMNLDNTLGPDMMDVHSGYGIIFKELSDSVYKTAVELDSITTPCGRPQIASVQQ